MTEPYFPEDWIIRSSTSRFFPAHSKFKLTRKGAGSADFELEVTWEKHAALKVIENFSLENSVWKGDIRRPKDERGQEEKFQLLVTSCPPGFDEKQRLWGLLLPYPSSYGDEGTGVWVAEAIPRKKPPGGSA
jgi:hypothetical protein